MRRRHAAFSSRTIDLGNAFDFDEAFVGLFPACPSQETFCSFNDDESDSLFNLGNSVASEGHGSNFLGFLGKTAKACANRWFLDTEADVKDSRYNQKLKDGENAKNLRESMLSDARLKILSLIAGKASEKWRMKPSSRDAIDFYGLSRDLSLVEALDVMKDFKKKLENALNENDLIAYLESSEFSPSADVIGILDDASKKGTTASMIKKMAKKVASDFLRMQPDYGDDDSLDGVVEEKLKKIAAVVEQRLCEKGVPGNEGGVLTTIRQLLENNGFDISELQDGVYRCSLELGGMDKRNLIDAVKIVRKAIGEQEDNFNCLSNALSMSKTDVVHPRNKNLKALEFTLVFSPVFPKSEVTPESLKKVFSGIRRFLTGKN